MSNVDPPLPEPWPMISMVVFIRWNGSYTRSDIWEINADGSGLKRLTHTPSWPEYGVVPSPDGRRIAFTRSFAQGDFDIFLMRPDGSHVKRLGPDTRRSEGQLDWLAT